MFKYKSPLSRILDGTGTPAEAGEDATGQKKTVEVFKDTDVLRRTLSGEGLEQQPHDDVSAPVADDNAPEDEADTVSEQANDEAYATPAIELVEASDDSLKQEEVAFSSEPTTNPEPPVLSEVMPEPAAAPEAAPAVAEASESLAANRRKRVKTTFIGFGQTENRVQDLMDSAPVAKSQAARASFPVGWLVISDGPGRGTSIALSGGLMQIGRNDDQSIQLDFGDNGISRSSHAVIAYDPEDRKCYLGHGGKANLVRLNDSPVLSTVALASGDSIRISKTTMRFAAFCDETFDWQDE
ncbi:FHA domain-containing protein [uncultured Ruegeria sp.]|uniref:FHA domain-containing protein n=1 Tax=uncultured Ruegeria sp. TaxID=259304 RepID=UPI002624C4EE|nr:FHA domain-containing protein [uncultured Ruegeria sp.]